MKVYVLYGSFCTSADGNDCMTPKVFGSVALAKELALYDAYRRLVSEGKLYQR